MGIIEDVITFCILLSPLVCGSKFPQSFKRCHLKDPDLDNCLVSSIENAFQLIGNSGIPSLKIPSIDPIEVARMEIDAGTDAVKLLQKYTDVKTYGYSKLKVISAHYHPEKKILSFESFHTQLDQKAHYHFDGKILVIPVFGNGESTITLYNVTVSHIINFEEKIKNNKNYFTVSKYKTKMEIKGAYFELTNLFNGDKKLSDAAHKIINENWEPFWKDVKEGVEKSYSEVFRLISDGFFSNTPLDEVFLK